MYGIFFGIHEISIVKSCSATYNSLKWMIYSSFFTLRFIFQDWWVSLLNGNGHKNMNAPSASHIFDPLIESNSFLLHSSLSSSSILLFYQYVLLFGKVNSTKINGYVFLKRTSPMNSRVNLCGRTVKLVSSRGGYESISSQLHLLFSNNLVRWMKKFKRRLT